MAHMDDKSQHAILCFYCQGHVILNPHLSILLVIIPMGQAKLFYLCKSLTSRIIANISLDFLVSFFADKAV